MSVIRKILRAALLALLMTVLIGGTVLAAYSYYADIQVQETDGNSYSYLPIIADVDNDYLSDNGYISLTGLDTRVLSGSTELKHLVADDKTLFVAPMVGGNSTGNYKYTLNNTEDLDSFPVVVGLDGYITIPSEISDDMQLGDDFEIEFDGYVDTSSGGAYDRLFYKKDAVIVYNSDTEEITAGIISSTTTNEDNTNAPNGAGFATGIESVTGAGTHWEAVDDPVATPDDDTTYVAVETSTSQVIDYYDLTGNLPDIPSDDEISGVKVYGRGKKEDAGKTSDFYLGLRLGGTDSVGANHGLTTSYAYYSDTIARPGGGDWTLDDFEDLQVILKLKTQTTSYYVRCTQVYVAIVCDSGYTFTLSTVLAGNSGGNHVWSASADGSYLMLSMDGDTSWDGVSSNRTALGGASVADNANDIIINQNNVMSYFDYLKWTVSDTLIAWYQPLSMIVGTTLDDREGTDAGETGTVEEDGIITWGENPAGVSATIGSLISSSQPEISPADEGDAVDIVPEGSIPSGGTVDTGALEDNPMYFLVEFISDNADLTEEQIWFGGATLIILIAMGIAVAKVPSHLLLAGTIGLVFSGFFTAMGIYQFWMMIIFGFVFVASLLMERKPVI